jgi:hypothetical protein
VWKNYAREAGAAFASSRRVETLAIAAGFGHTVALVSPPLLNASQLTTGSVPDSRLSTNVPLLSAGKLNDSVLSGNVALLNGSQTFTGANAFNQLSANSLGVGTNDSTVKVSIAGVPNYNSGLKLTGSSANGTGLALNNTAGGGHQFALFSSGTNNTIGAGGFAIYDDTAVRWCMVVASNGNVGIGTSSPDNLLTVNGSADKPGGGSWGTYSDGRLKDVGENFTPGLESLEQLQPVHYYYKSDNPLKLPSGPEYVGLVAQQVQQAIPEAVQRTKDGYLVVNNDPIIWTMLNAIKELDDQAEGRKQKPKSKNSRRRSRS